jgi:hypothetical protein
LGSLTGKASEVGLSPELAYTSKFMSLIDVYVHLVLAGHAQQLLGGYLLCYASSSEGVMY